MYTLATNRYHQVWWNRLVKLHPKWIHYYYPHTLVFVANSHEGSNEDRGGGGGGGGSGGEALRYLVSWKLTFHCQEDIVSPTVPTRYQLNELLALPKPVLL